MRKLWNRLVIGGIAIAGVTSGAILAGVQKDNDRLQPVSVVEPPPQPRPGEETPRSPKRGEKRPRYPDPDDCREDIWLFALEWGAALS